MSNLATSLRDQGKHAEAEQMRSELLDVRRRVLGPEHPDTLATVRNLASLDSIRSVSTSIVPFASRTLTTSHPADSEPRSSSALWGWRLPGSLGPLWRWWLPGSLRPQASR